MSSIHSDSADLVRIEADCRQKARAIEGRSALERWRKHTLLSTAHCAALLRRGSEWHATTSTMNRRIARAAIYLGVESHI